MKKKEKTPIAKYIILGVMIFSLAGLSFSILLETTPIGTGQANSYNGFPFVFNPQFGGFQYEYEGVVLVSFNHPSETEMISIPQASMDQITSAREMGISFSAEPDPGVNEAVLILRESFGRGLRKTTVPGLYDLDPVMDCSAATAQFPIVQIIRGNVSEVWNEDYCTVIEYTDQFDLILHTDALIFRSLGVVR